MVELGQKIYNISASNSFGLTLAEFFLQEFKDNPLALSDVLFLLPNRRACKDLKDAFVQVQGLSPTLLPKMMPIADVEEDELFFGSIESGDALLSLSPAIEKNERLLLFVRLIMAKPKEFGLEKMSLAQACFLAQELSSLIDMADNENLNFDELKNLVPEEYSAHWQETLKFLEIITSFWPDILKERGLIDAGERRNRLLLAQAQIWQQNKPSKRIVIAGSTATFPAMKELVKTVLKLPNGQVFLSGLDKFLDEKAWEEVDETHPQFELKDLLSFLQISRCEVQDFVAPLNKAREELISEIMRPAKTTDKWLDIAAKKIEPSAIYGINLIDCKDIREEAIAIALIMRQALEIPEKTAALVTSDRNLARRVASELERWNVKVDDSAGKPLSLSPVGVFLRLVAQVCEKDFAKVSFLSLLKHPFSANGMDYASLRKTVREVEKKLWRSDKQDEELSFFVARFQENMRELYEFYQNPKANFKQMLKAHIKLAEKLATTSDKNGEQILWKGDAGEAAANFIADLYAKAEVLGEIESFEYLSFFEALMSGVMVRPKYGTHPRLKILGPIEARLNSADVVIVGELNEGIWPKTAGADPWMSRPMKKDFGFPLPEKAIGVMAHDFSSLLAKEEVYLTRAERVQGTPMVKSRWWMRLETVLKALDIKISTVEDLIYRLLAQNLDKPSEFVRIGAPQPRPPVSARPRELSASAIEMLMRDPYAIYAKFILRLKPLDELDKDLSMADYGNIIHEILENFNNKYPSVLPKNSREELLSLGEEYFKANAVAAERRAFWWPSFEKTVDWLIEVEKVYRPEVARVHNEAKGRLSFVAPAGEFVITAKADRVDETKDGKLNVIDYKTGRARSLNEIRKGFAPQLPIEGIIAKKGGFGEIPAKDIKALIYWQLAKKQTILEENVDEVVEENWQRVKELIHLFDFETTPYISQPNPKRVPEYSDYEHLARVKEWAIVDEESDE